MIRWTRVEAIPPKGETSPTPREDGFAAERGRRQAEYAAVLRDFVSSDAPHARITFDEATQDARSVRSGLEGTIRREGIAGVSVALRGDRLYLTRPRETRVTDRARATLAEFVASGDTSRLVCDSIGDTALFHALHYRRTRDGMGFVRITRTPDGIVLTDTTARGEGR